MPVPRSITDPTRRSIKRTFNGEDGHIYYVIASDGSRVYMGIQFLERYPDLDQHVGKPGLFFVRNAASDIQIDEEGIEHIVQNGDPTVHKGWAMYCWDGYAKGASGGGWRKVAEQESVDGPWGIDEIILNSLVKKSDFNMFKASIEERVTINTNNIQSIQQVIRNFNESIAELNRLKHGHNNKDALDKLDDSCGNLSYNGKIVGGTLLYDNVSDGKLYWVDPTFVPTEEVPEFDPIECENSLDVATRFADCSLASVGLSFEVIEVDGSISRYDIVRDESDELIPVFRDSSIKGSYGSVSVVDVLPEASVAYDGRGVWYPIGDDGVHQAFTMYASKNGEWITLAQFAGANTTILKIGAMKVAAFVNADPAAPLKKNHIIWKEPTDTYTDPTTGIKYTWGKTVLVRKYGSSPSSVSDGTIVYTNYNIGSSEFFDVCPYGGTDEVYYRLFSFTKAGAAYSAEVGFVPNYPSWTDMFTFIRDNPLDVIKVIKAGDKLVLPDHPLFGDIVCTVLNVDQSGITVSSDKVLDKLIYDARNGGTATTHNYYEKWLDINFGEFTKYVVCKESKKIADKPVYIFQKEIGYIELELNDGDSFPEGVTVYERNAEFSDGMIKIKSAIPEFDSESTDGVFPWQDLPMDLINRNMHYNGEKETTAYWCKIGTKLTDSSDPAEDVNPAEDSRGVIVILKLGI